MRFFYNILFTLFFCLSAPYYFLKMWRRGNWQAGFGQRFGRFEGKLKQALTNRDVIWLHAVSVGEVNVCTELIAALQVRLPNMKFVVSTTTSTGMEILRKKLPAHIEKIYYPIDRRAIVIRAVSAIHPSAVVLVEAEIWPNFLWFLRDARIPVFLVNARLSDRSLRGYKRFGFLFRGLFSSFARIGSQNEQDVKRLIELGCRPECVRLTGNMKFDAVKVNERSQLDVASLLRQLGVAPGARILLAGSTHKGEEELLAQQFLRLRRQFPDLFLILVPRHFERCKSVGKIMRAREVKFAYRSKITTETVFKPGEIDCLIVDTTGELIHFYKQATVVFVGKTIKAKGGQNPIEPGILGKAMLFGPNMQNFRDVAAAFVQGNGAIQVADAAGLEKAVGELLSDAGRRDQLGRNAQDVVRRNQGAVERTADMLNEFLIGRK
jgi:3-deoxy-D-manno-octulosonic-acid transferase